jgi:hypothetical protein
VLSTSYRPVGGEATPAQTYDAVAATKTMLDRTDACAPASPCFSNLLPCPRLSSLSHLNDLSLMGLDCPSGIPPHVNVLPAQLALKVDERTFELLFTNQALSRNKAATCGSHSGHTEGKLDDVDLSCSVGATHGMKCNCSQPRKRRILHR